MKVSIITRTINRPSLQKVKELVQNQTYDNIEHIIVSGFDRFNAADQGFKKATGDVILLLDDDDLIDPNHVEEAIKHFTPDVYYVNTGFKTRISSPVTGEIRERNQGGIFIPNKTVFFTHSSSFFFRAQLLEEFNYLNENYYCPCEDAAFYSDIAMHYKGVFTGAYSSTYILNTDNTSGLHGTLKQDNASVECIQTIRKIISHEEFQQQVLLQSD